jgi:hypothetical protein
LLLDSATSRVAIVHIGRGRRNLWHGCWYRESERERLAVVYNLIFLLEPINT